MAELTSKVLASIKEWRTETYLGLLCLALFAAFAGDKVIELYRGNPEYAAIRADLAELTRGVKQNAATAQLQAVTIDYFVCDAFAASDTGARSKCWADYQAAKREIARIQ
jgi:hypothetical protein